MEAERKILEKRKVISESPDQLETAVEDGQILTPDNPTDQAKVAAFLMIAVAAFGYAESY